MQNNNDYNNLLESKKIKLIESGFDVDYSEICPLLFDYQKFIVEKALKRGKCAIFAECGLGKTFIQLEWARQVVLNTNSNVIILCPLGVLYQTIDEALKINIDVHVIKGSNYELNNNSKIYISNYQQIENIDFTKFNGIVLDESSILKNISGQTRNALIEKTKNIEYKLACTATPSPNDPMELGNHAEFLNAMNYNAMLAKYFIHDGGETQKWKLKGHAENDFYSFVGEWSIVLSNPQDIGFDGSRFILPQLNYNEVIIETPKKDNGLLINDDLVSATEFNAELKRTINERLNKVAEIANNIDGQVIIWIKLNEEGEILRKLIPDAVEVSGSDNDDIKEKNLLGFAKNNFRVLITKTKIASFGLNYQNCCNQIFATMDYSFEQTYQAVRRSHRFGQKNAVNIFFIITDTMKSIANIVKQKEENHTKLIREINNIVNDIKDISEKKYCTNDIKHDRYQLMYGDCVKRIQEIGDSSIDLSVFSPPFANLYSYSDKIEDMGNVVNYNDFAIQFEFLVKELYRVMKSGRLVAIHCCNLPILKGKDGFIGLRDFPGMIINLFTKHGFIFHTEICIWKDPVVEMQRTKALGLLHKQVKKDSSMSRVGIPDKILAFRKDGINETPIRNIEINVDEWQKIASPVWMDINYSNTLQYRTAKDNKDEKHICPLQLDTIERIIKLWSNPNETVFTPFMGIGSEVYQALKMNRNGIGIELKDSYYHSAIKNCADVVAESDMQPSLFE